MASAKFLEEALSTDVDESAVSAIVGSLETQLVTSSTAVSSQTGATVVINQNHLNSNSSASPSASAGNNSNSSAGGVPNGGAGTQQQHTSGNNGSKQHIANGESIGGGDGQPVHKPPNNNNIVATSIGYHLANSNSQSVAPATEQVKIVYTQHQAAQMAATGALRQQQQQPPLPNGTLLAKPLVIKGQAGGQAGATQPSGLVTVPVAPQPAANNVGSPAQTQSPIPLSNLQVVNVRPGVPITQAQKGQPARVVLSAPQIVGARAAAPQLTLQSFHSLQPGQQGHLLLKTENGQFQLLRVGVPTANLAAAASSAPGQPVTFRMQTVQPAVSSTSTTSTQPIGTTAVVTSVGQQVQTVTTVQARPANDNTKEKCRKFLANLLELSSREPRAVERNVRTLIQELIDMKVEPEDFCDKLERLLNASPQPCLIGFLKKSLPLLRHSLATREMTIDGIRPPPPSAIQTAPQAVSVAQIRPTAVLPTAAGAQQVRLVSPSGAPVQVRPGTQVLQQRLVAPAPQAQIRPQQPRMVAAAGQIRPQQQVIVSGSQPPALHPVFPAGQQQVRAGQPVTVRQPLQIKGVTSTQLRQGQQVTIRTSSGAIVQQGKSGGPVSLAGKQMGGIKGPVAQQGKSGGLSSGGAGKDKERKAYHSSSAAYTGDDDINDVAAMGGVNLAEETQKILGSTEYVGTQIRSCKEDLMCSVGPLQAKIRRIVARHGLEEPGADVLACVSHAAQERLKNLLEKLAINAEHRLEIVKSDQRYEITSDVKGQLKFLEEVDRAERKRHEELEREMLMRAAKSRSKTEDPEQAKLKAKAKEMQRVEMEELRQREANATALQAIGPRKRPRLDQPADQGAQPGSSQASGSGPSSGARGQLPLRQRMKKVSVRDLQYVFEQEKDLCRSRILFKSYLK